MRDIHEILKNHWGFDQFRPLQEDIISSILANKDTLALMPTGGGKSLCFQVPALARDGLCLVISPLIALMQDQVANLQKANIKALALHSGMSYREIDYALDRCVHGDIKLLYVSPERIQSDLFQARVKRMKLNLIAVDEAHCISQWGYDFRPPYLQIADLREIHPKTPVLALTATATEDVVEDIQDKLAFRKGNVFRKSFIRENLAYMVFHEENKRDRLRRICEKMKGSGVVYVRNRRKTTEIADFLQRCNISALAYHAGLSGAIRSQRQQAWTQNEVRVIVATNAFGMGIDKPDVRFVVHLDLPEDIESYFQEAGRGGRDGKKAFAVILKETSDVIDLEEKVLKKFPPPDIIRKTYRALLNHLQLAAGSGMDETFPMDLPSISKTFDLKPLDVYNSLKLLESDGYLTFNEAFYNPSRIRVLVQQQTLYDFELRNANLSPIIQLILRAYSGVFDQAVKIDEKQIAKRLNLGQGQVSQQLQRLHEREIIDYSPARDTAMVTFTQPAQYDRDLRLSDEIYTRRKKTALTKLEAMKAYLEPGICRQRRLLAYFGEKSELDCGKCDICLQKKKSIKLSETVEERILNAVREKALRPDEIADTLTDYSRELVLKQLTFLVDEQTLAYQPDKTLVINQKNNPAKTKLPDRPANETKP